MSSAMIEIFRSNRQCIDKFSCHVHAVHSTPGVEMYHGTIFSWLEAWLPNLQSHPTQNCHNIRNEKWVQHGNIIQSLRTLKDCKVLRTAQLSFNSLPILFSLVTSMQLKQPPPAPVPILSESKLLKRPPPDQKPWQTLRVHDLGQCRTLQPLPFLLQGIAHGASWETLAENHWRLPWFDCNDFPINPKQCKSAGHGQAENPLIKPSENYNLQSPKRIPKWLSCGEVWGRMISCDEVYQMELFNL